MQNTYWFAKTNIYGNQSLLLLFVSNTMVFNLCAEKNFQACAKRFKTQLSIALQPFFNVHNFLETKIKKSETDSI